MIIVIIFPSLELHLQAITNHYELLTFNEINNKFNIRANLEQSRIVSNSTTTSTSNNNNNSDNNQNDSNNNTINDNNNDNNNNDNNNNNNNNNVLPIHTVVQNNEGVLLSDLEASLVNARIRALIDYIREIGGLFVTITTIIPTTSKRY